jgi:hypothetical protein
MPAFAPNGIADSDHAEGSWLIGSARFVRDARIPPSAFGWVAELNGAE